MISNCNKRHTFSREKSPSSFKKYIFRKLQQMLKLSFKKNDSFIFYSHRSATSSFLNQKKGRRGRGVLNSKIIQSCFLFLKEEINLSQLNEKTCIKYLLCACLNSGAHEDTKIYEVSQSLIWGSLHYSHYFYRCLRIIIITTMLTDTQNPILCN